VGGAIVESLKRYQCTIKG